MRAVRLTVLWVLVFIASILYHIGRYANWHQWMYWRAAVFVMQVASLFSAHKYRCWLRLRDVQ